MKNKVSHFIVALLILCWTACDTVNPPDTTTTTTITGMVNIERVSGPNVLNSSGRALFANVLINTDTVWTTYQTAGQESLTSGKNLYWRSFDRDLVELTGEEIAIDVSQTIPVDWKGDLGDQKLVLLNDVIYMVAILRDHDTRASIVKFDTAFQYLSGPYDFGMANSETEQHLDMGFGTDGEKLYAQFLNKNGDTPEDWGAGIYRLSQDCEVELHKVVEPEEGSFVTGTAIVFVPEGQMDASQNRLQIFSTNKDYGNTERVGIHTFAADMDLNMIEDSRIDIIERELDTYFPTGPSWNRTHQLWIVGYTMENYEGELPDNELGPSFITVFDPQWQPIATIALNDGQPAFRVMTQTMDDDIYVVYDEMDKEGDVENSQAKIEHFRITIQ